MLRFDYAMTQREAVYLAVRMVIGPNNRKLNKRELTRVHRYVMQMLQSGEVAGINFSWDVDTFKRYVPNLVQNWLRKEDRFRG